MAITAFHASIFQLFRLVEKETKSDFT